MGPPDSRVVFVVGSGRSRTPGRHSNPGTAVSSFPRQPPDSAPPDSCSFPRQPPTPGPQPYSPSSISPHPPHRQECRKRVTQEQWSPGPNNTALCPQEPPWRGPMRESGHPCPASRNRPGAEDPLWGESKRWQSQSTANATDTPSSHPEARVACCPNDTVILDWFDNAHGFPPQGVISSVPAGARLPQAEDPGRAIAVFTRNRLLVAGVRPFEMGEKFLKSMKRRARPGFFGSRGDPGPCPANHRRYQPPDAPVADPGHRTTALKR